MEGRIEWEEIHTFFILFRFFAVLNFIFVISTYPCGHSYTIHLSTLNFVEKINGYLAL